MGQNSSSPDVEHTALSPSNSTIERVHKDDIIDMFHRDSKRLVRQVEAKAIINKVNSTSLNEKNVLTPSDLAYLFQLSAKKEEDISVRSPKLSSVVHFIYGACKVMANYPFLYATIAKDQLLTLDDLLVSSLFHSGRSKKIVGKDIDYTKVLFISLSHKSLEGHAIDRSDRRAVSESPLISPSSPKSINNEKVPVSSDTYKVAFVKSDDDASQIIWPNFEVVKDYDGINVDELTIGASDVHQLLSLFLLLGAISKSSRSKMQQNLQFLVKERWEGFEEFSSALLKHLDIGVTTDTLSQKQISYRDLFSGKFPMLGKLISEEFGLLFKGGLLSSNFEDNDLGPMPEPLVDKSQRTSIIFQESKLVTYPTIATIGHVLKAIGSNTKVTKENLVKLYIGREAGFSIRSLESKIFKWQAPTLFVVSGKRLKNKTASTNRRYIQFDSEFPRYFRSSESKLRDWQHDSDRVTYAVLVTQPWQLSNKKNFGNNESLIISLQPHVDYFQSTNNPVLGTDSVYFNTLGLGIGFGNNQPINKNGVKKYLPGDVSLTIESNLEFAVFRHILSSKGNSYFNTSQQQDITGKDYEDRFIITDLEVWGIGSTKELEHQKKQWEWEQKQAEARQSVNLRNMGEERAFMEMVGLVGNHGAGGSV